MAYRCGLVMNSIKHYCCLGGAVIEVPLPHSNDYMQTHTQTPLLLINKHPHAHTAQMNHTSKCVSNYYYYTYMSS